MKILCLCKRRPQGRDLFNQPYGRFHQLPRLLAERGHDVHLLLLSYRNDPQAYRRENRLHIYSSSAVPFGPLPYLTKAKQIAQATCVDWVIGFSDTWFGIVAEYLAHSLGTRVLIDAYDNYESYMPWAKPLHWAWRRALARAEAITAAGPQLAEWMSISAGGRPVEVVPMAADPIFSPMNKTICRERLGLPTEGILAGYMGALHPNRGIDVLFSVLSELRMSHPKLEVVLSGRLAKGIELPPGIHWLGYRAPEEVPVLLNSLDLLFVVNKQGPFGDYSYPAKLYEAMACGIPVVAADLPGTAWVLRDYPEMLARAGDVDDFINKALSVLGLGGVCYPHTEGWMNSANILEGILRREKAKV